MTDISSLDRRRLAELFDGASRGEAFAEDLQLVARPGDPVPSLAAGDLVVRRALGEGWMAFAAELASGRPEPRAELEARGVECEGPGDEALFEVVERRTGRRRAWPLLDPLGRLRPETVVLSDRGRQEPGVPFFEEAEAIAAEVDSWPERLAWVKERLRSKAYEEAARWLGGQSIDDVEKHILSKLKRKRVAQIHISAKKHLGKDHPLAKKTRYRYEVARFLLMVAKEKWDKAGKYLNGFSPFDIIKFLARLPLEVIPKIAEGAKQSVGTGSNSYKYAHRPDVQYPAFFLPRRSDRSKAPDGSKMLGGWTDKGDPRPDIKKWLAREKAMLDQLLTGNIPQWLRQWKPITFTLPRSGKPDLEGTLYVLPDYLCAGGDTDFVHLPLDQQSAQKAASKLGGILPTAKICHRIYQSVPKPQRLNIIPRTKLPPGAAQTSSAGYLEHSRLLRERIKSRGLAFGTLVAGHKKDVVLSKHHKDRPNHIAFHGFYDANEVPVQPCYNQKSGGAIPNCNANRPTLAHPEGRGRFSDYSQGVRLVHRWMIVDGKRRSVRSVLADSEVAKLISDEGTIDPARVPRP